ncbi:S9 family peptidase [Fluoribacter dumoffii]|uniref:S9 family peptidase n=1 Tax=Fluoribacter dumoffii TaxID=463 RepID=UPI00224473A8|nr:S9 family peptidase [Fluoribacter dumoffii]MCW8418221.1 S9 family peptidase [Fluoribacter dumoffii]MCW8453937.1 S9 family peptidase [Fluoribacter dumoffii]MCW8461992.1 S9 family peptidase [Fluoribacter dumoffii]
MYYVYKKDFILKKILIGVLPSLFVLFFLPYNGYSSQRLPVLSDFMQIKTVDEPDLSKDGKWVAYSVEENVSPVEAIRNIWMVSYEGNVSKQLTSSKKESNYLPKWSPDGQWIAFLSDHNDLTSLKLLNIQNGQIIQLTHAKYDISDFAWAPNSQNIAFIAEEVKDEKESKNKPIVITRFLFKKDREGYLGEKRAHLYRIAIATKNIEILTPGPYQEWAPSWSPDGNYIAFVSQRGVDPDRIFNSDVYVINTKSGSKAVRLTQSSGTEMNPEWESSPSWNPESTKIVYLTTSDKSHLYAPTQLAIIGLEQQEQLIAPLDLWFTQPKWSEDGKKIYALVETSRNTHLSEIDVRTGAVKNLTHGPRVDGSFATANQRIVVVSSDDQHPQELFAVENTLRPLTHHNQKLLEQVKFVPAEDIEFKSSDGTLIEGLLIKPAPYESGHKYPTLLNLHGGPVYQFSHEFNFDWQWFAVQGYAIIAPNPRGSSGRGYNFSKAIYADWGNLDVKDVLAAVDYAINEGIADPDKLAVGGWSYGGMLTDYIIASTQRFKAAVSGAGTGNILGNYGADQYTLEYEAELGKPWLNVQTYLKLSYPLIKANKIKTPTLFMCASLDFNMPCIGSEQLYQALRSQNIPTQLIIYPEQYHSIDRPDFQMDRLVRFKAWMDLYLNSPKTHSDNSHKK